MQVGLVASSQSFWRMFVTTARAAPARPECAGPDALQQLRVGQYAPDVDRQFNEQPVLDVG